MHFKSYLFSVCVPLISDLLNTTDVEVDMIKSFNLSPKNYLLKSDCASSVKLSNCNVGLQSLALIKCETEIDLNDSWKTGLRMVLGFRPFVHA